MSYSSVLKQEKFWQVLKYLSDLTAKKSWDEVCGDLSITTKQLNSFLVFFKEVNFVFKIDGDESKETFLIPPEETPKIEMNFSLLEWLEFQAHFSYLEEASSEPFHDEFQMKMEEFENEYKAFDLFSPLDVFEHSQGTVLEILNEESILQQEVLSSIEKSILGEEVISLSFHNKNEREIAVFPRKIVYLDGSLSLVCENIFDNTLMQIEIRSISSTHPEDEQWQPVFTQSEMDDFVSSMRKMSDYATRLVLKIKSYERFQLNLGHQFFENPCVFTNGTGDIIWAATIEPNEKIFDWLASLGQDVEILESTDFKRKYLEYCESRLKKLA